MRSTSEFDDAEFIQNNLILYRQSKVIQKNTPLLYSKTPPNTEEHRNDYQPNSLSNTQNDVLQNDKESSIQYSNVNPPVRDIRKENWKNTPLARFKSFDPKTSNDNKDFEDITKIYPIFPAQKGDRDNIYHERTKQLALAIDYEYFNEGPTAQLTRDAKLWRLTLRYPGHPQRLGILQRIFTVLRYGGLLFRSDENGNKWRWWHETNWPIASALSHGGRVLIQLPMIKGDPIHPEIDEKNDKERDHSFWRWLITGDENGDLSQIISTMTNGDDADAEGKLIFKRLAGSHGIDYNVEPVELPLGRRKLLLETKTIGFTLRDTKVLANDERVLHHHRHWGMNIPLGGHGRYSFINERISANGEHGHIYIYYMSSARRRCGGLLIGCEASEFAKWSQTGHKHTIRADSGKYSVTFGHKWRWKPKNKDEVHEILDLRDLNGPIKYNGMFIDLSNGWKYLKKAEWNDDYVMETSVPVKEYLDLKQAAVTISRRTQSNLIKLWKQRENDIRSNKRFERKKQLELIESIVDEEANLFLVKDKYKEFKLTVIDRFAPLFPKMEQAFLCKMEEFYGKIFADETFHDVTFLVGPERDEVTGNSTLLGARNVVMKEIFFGSQSMREQQHKIVTIPDAEVDYFVDFLNFLYTNEVKFSPRNIVGLFYLAYKFQDYDLRIRCEQYLFKILAPLNAIQMLDVFLKMGRTDLVNHVMQIIIENTTECISAEKSIYVSKPTVKLILAEDVLNCKEEELYDWAKKWAKGRGEDLIQHPDLVNLIRIPVMNPKKIKEIYQTTPFLSKDTYISILEFKLMPQEFADIQDVRYRKREAYGLESPHILKNVPFVLRAGPDYDIIYGKRLDSTKGFYKWKVRIERIKYTRIVGTSNAIIVGVEHLPSQKIYGQKLFIHRESRNEEIFDCTYKCSTNMLMIEFRGKMYQSACPMPLQIMVKGELSNFNVYGRLEVE